MQKTNLVKRNTQRRKTLLFPILLSILFLIPFSFSFDYGSPLASWTYDNSDLSSDDALECVNGNYTLTNAGSVTTGATGVINEAFDYSGSANNFLSNDDFYTDFLTGESTFTLSMWVKQDDTVNRWYFSTPGRQLSFYPYNNANYFVEVGGTGGGIYFPVSNGALTELKHVLIVYNGSESNANRVKVYINGTQTTSNNLLGTTPTTMPSDTTFYLGRRGDSPTGFHNGIIDEFIVWRGVPNSTQINDIFTSSINPCNIVTNSAPTIDDFAYDDLAPYFESQTVTLNYTIGDVDNDTLSVNISWFNSTNGTSFEYYSDNTEIRNVNSTTYASPILSTTSTLQPEVTPPLSYWFAQLTISDGAETVQENLSSIFMNTSGMSIITTSVRSSEFSPLYKGMLENFSLTGLDNDGHAVSLRVCGNNSDFDTCDILCESDSDQNFSITEPRTISCSYATTEDTYANILYFYLYDDFEFTTPETNYFYVTTDAELLAPPVDSIPFGSVCAFHESQSIAQSIIYYILAGLTLILIIGGTIVNKPLLMIVTPFTSLFLVFYSVPCNTVLVITWIVICAYSCLRLLYWGVELLFLKQFKLN